MKHNRLIRSMTVLLVALVIMSGFSLTAYASSNEEWEYTEPISAEPEETTGGYDPQPLTPKGNMTLVDDIDGDKAEDKQFIIVKSKGGDYFYIVVDRAASGENSVHFLNQVDETDLLSLVGDGETTPDACNCADKCVVGAVDISCPICKNNMAECVGKEKPIEMPVKPENLTDEPTDEKPSSNILIFILLIVLGGSGAAFYFLKFRKAKSNVKGPIDLDDYDYNDDEGADRENAEETLEDTPENEDNEDFH